MVLTVAALVGTSRGLEAGESQARQDAAAAVAVAAAEAYRDAGGWTGADLRRADALAASAGARLGVRDAAGGVVAAPDGAAGGQGSGAGRGAVTAPVVVDGATVGTVRLAFGSPATSTAQQIAWTWILVAAVAALLVALVAAWFVTRRIAAPLVRLAGVARAFAAGDREARPRPADVDEPGELGELARSFDATAEAVVRSERARRDMSADVAHELRTPLAALQAGLEELRDGLEPATPERLAALHAQAVRLGRVVGDLAELSAAETAALAMHVEPVDLGLLVGEAVAAAMPALASARLQVRTDLADDVMVTGDADRLHQAVGNVLANAARYCRPGDEVTVGVSASAGLARITVADTGPGIAPEDLPHVFDRLWRGRADADPAGSGIGLAVVRELVVAHGGRVQADSDGASGTTVTLVLPLAPVPA